MTEIRTPKLPCTAAAAAVALALLAAGCGSSSSGSSADKSIQPAPSSSQSSAPAPTPTVSTPTTTANPALAKKPTIAKPSGPPPKKLIIRDLVKGTGPAAVAGESLTVQYVGVLYSNAKQFDSSWDQGRSPFMFTLGVGGVIPGWDQGLVGMHVGGRRQLVIPAALAYGKQSQPGVAPNVGIPANSALIFDVDLLSAQPPA
jgi:peptidylprolyl isomerase